MLGSSRVVIQAVCDPSTSTFSPSKPSQYVSLKLLAVKHRSAGGATRHHEMSTRAARTVGGAARPAPGPTRSTSTTRPRAEMASAHRERL